MFIVILFLCVEQTDFGIQNKGKPHNSTICPF